MGAPASCPRVVTDMDDSDYGVYGAISLDNIAMLNSIAMAIGYFVLLFILLWIVSKFVDRLRNWMWQRIYGFRPPPSGWQPPGLDH
jgi:hypothetical protein